MTIELIEKREPEEIHIAKCSCGHKGCNREVIIRKIEGKIDLMVGNDGQFGEVILDIDGQDKIRIAMTTMIIIPGPEPGTGEHCG